MSLDAIPLLRASQLRPVITALKRIGAPTEAYFRASKLPLLACDDAEAVVPELFVWDLAGRVAQGEGMEDFGGFAASVLPLWKSEPELVFRLQSLTTLWIALSTFCKLVEHFSTSVPYRIERVGGRALFHRGKLPGNRGEDQVELYALRIMIQLVRLAAGPNWKPPEILVSAATVRRLSEREEFDGVRLRESDACTGVFIPVDVLASPMAALASESGTNLPDRLPNDFLESLRSIMSTYLQDRRPDVHLAAEMAGVSERTLQRWLHDSRLTYRGLLDQIRLEQALSMLSEPAAQITDIAYELGFSDAAHFTRAFRRWTALSPREYRRQQRAA